MSMRLCLLVSLFVCLFLCLFVILKKRNFKRSSSTRERSWEIGGGGGGAEMDQKEETMYTDR